MDKDKQREIAKKGDKSQHKNQNSDTIAGESNPADRAEKKGGQGS